MAAATELRALLLALASLPALAAADTLRCGSALVSDGDPIEKVLALCGEPAQRTRSWIQRQPRFELGGREVPFPGREDVPVDLWTYDLGASRLMRRIRFVDGKVESIVTLEHGTSPR
jgi:Protein of unknown function (DUF2845)